MSDNRQPEIEIKKEIDIESEIEIEQQTGQATLYGKYSNILLTDTELSELQTELPGKWEYYIDRLSEIYYNFVGFVEA